MYVCVASDVCICASCLSASSWHLRLRVTIKALREYAASPWNALACVVHTGSDTGSLTSITTTSSVLPAAAPALAVKLSLSARLTKKGKHNKLSQ